MDGEKHLFASPRNFATIRIDPGHVGRWGDVHPTLRVFLMLKGIPGKPRAVRFGEFRGLHGGHVNEKGRRIDLWSLGATTREAGILRATQRMPAFKPRC